VTTRGAAALGLLIGAAANLSAFVLSGAGHGWNTPLWVSPLLLIVYPLVLARAVIAAASPRIEYAVLLAAVASDIILAALAYREGLEYLWTEVRVGGVFLVLWIAAWLGWQVVAALNLVRSE
jgi:hypothetical protein